MQSGLNRKPLRAHSVNSTWLQIKDPDDLKREFMRGELEPSTPYYVRMSAVNSDGEGVKSDPISFTTVSGGRINNIRGNFWAW